MRCDLLGIVLEVFEFAGRGIGLERFQESFGLVEQGYGVS